MGEILYFSRRVAQGSVTSQEERLPVKGYLTHLSIGFPSGGGLGVQLTLFPPDKVIFPYREEYVDFKGPLSPMRMKVPVSKDNRLQARWQSSLGTASYAPILVLLEER